MKRKHDSHTKSVVKAVTWRVVASTTTAMTAWLLTGNWRVAVGTGLIAGAVKIFLYYVHERIWLKIHL